jgi:hypothetical protein
MRCIILACALAGVLGVPAFWQSPYILTLPAPAFGQGVDPLVGTWKLNVEKSTSTVLGLPKSLT